MWLLIIIYYPIVDQIMIIVSLNEILLSTVLEDRAIINIITE